MTNSPFPLLARESSLLNVQSSMYKIAPTKEEKYNRLTVIKEVPRGDAKDRQILCKCDCGKNTKCTPSQLVSGNNKSCGCLNTERRRAMGEANKIHGLTKSPAHKSWTAMMERCYTTSANRYEEYGGRGIVVCNKWHDFRNFLEDMGPRPPNHSIDRIDNDGNYCPENCRWATRSQQCRNRKNNHFLEINGKRKTITEWSVIKNINATTLCDRIKASWPQDKLFISPSPIPLCER